IVVRLLENSGSIRHRIEQIDGNGDVVISRLLWCKNVGGTDDMAEWHIFIEMGNCLLADEFNLVLENIVDCGMAGCSICDPSDYYECYNALKNVGNGNNNNNANNNNNNANNNQPTGSSSTNHVTIPINHINNKAGITARVVDGRAVFNLSTNEVRRIIADSNEAAIFDLSEMDVTSVLIPRQTVRQLAAAELGIKVVLPHGKILLDADAANSLGQLAQNNNIVISIEESEQPLTFYISISAGRQEINTLRGVIIISLPYEGPLPVYVWRLDEYGELVLVKAGANFNEYTGRVEFATNTPGTFILGTGAPMVDDAPLAFVQYEWEESAPAVESLQTPPMPVVRQRSNFIINLHDYGTSSFIDPETNRVMVPVRMFAETLGMNVVWQDSTRAVRVVTPEGVTELPVDEPLPNGFGTPVIINGSTFVPLRFIAEIFGAEVVWDRESVAAIVTL
ncbi:MAG: copper amine oxidase N-terminal domain-containing protein, partial [Firmicutes bacterium]|nr:copper amine oxidase N-terminal domain-containing protein [Bacillota bacterium]